MQLARREKNPTKKPSSQMTAVDIDRYICSAWFFSLRGSPGPRCQELGSGRFPILSQASDVMLGKFLGSFLTRWFD